MDLDLSKLSRLSLKGAKEQATDTQPPTSPVNPSRTPENGTGTESFQEDLKPTEANLDGVGSIVHLQTIADAKRKEIERAEAICREYQRNIMHSSQLQAEMLKGVRAGEDMHSLFLKAAKAISLMTENALFYDLIEGDVRAIYGVGLGDAPALQMELDQVRERYRRLKASLDVEPNGDSRDRIQRAVTAHENRIRELEKRLKT